MFHFIPFLIFLIYLLSSLLLLKIRNYLAGCVYFLLLYCWTVRLHCQCYCKLFIKTPESIYMFYTSHSYEVHIISIDFSWFSPNAVCMSQGFGLATASQRSSLLMYPLCTCGVESEGRKLDTDSASG